MTARYAPKGWEDDVPQEGQDAVAKALDAFQGLVLNEGHFGSRNYWRCSEFNR